MSDKKVENAMFFTKEDKAWVLMQDLDGNVIGVPLQDYKYFEDTGTGVLVDNANGEYNDYIED